MERAVLLSIIEKARSTRVHGLSLVNQNISELPPEIGVLDELEHLDISHNLLTVLPRQLGALRRLKRLNASNNAITSLPVELGDLSALEGLDLTNNALTTVPECLASMAEHLQELAFGGNRLYELPHAICKLTNLQCLWVNHNYITELPTSLMNLKSLSYLNLANNKIYTLPSFLGFMTQIETLDVDGMDVRVPPRQVTTQGTRATLGFLREWADGDEQRWMSKVLVVGDGGVGKTSLVRSLFDDDYRQNESPTHGINIQTLRLQHPERKDVEMLLNIWDFGGQEIYHATHQFFLSDRALFLLVWNTRAGYEQCRVMHWLETINALAPSSPIVIVATHADQREPDLPLGQICEKYKKVISPICVISNVNKHGVLELFDVVAKSASTLPLMGERWPRTWIRAAEAIRAIDERYVTPNRLRTEMISRGVAELSWPTLAQWLHELGDILYFPTHEELKDTVILKPQWVTAYISRVLDDTAVSGNHGILTKEDLERLWYDLEPDVRSHFLILMECFDLSYRTLENKDISLVVEQLSLDPPAYKSRWEEEKGGKEISMRFWLSAMPAGIPTWFIARSHRFTTWTHWRTGALFAYGPEQRHLAYTLEQTHLALVQADRHDRCVELIVRGPNPLGFFSVLRDGLELTLNRFPGLKIQRRIPCPGHQGIACSHEFDYVQLLRRWEKNRRTVECPQGLEEVDVVELLFGLHWSTDDAVLKHLQDLNTRLSNTYNTQMRYDILYEIKSLRELVQLRFTNTFRREQAKIDSYCPNVFVLSPHNREEILGRLASGTWPWFGAWPGSSWLDAIAGQRLDVKLFCQAPGCWHPVQEGGQYELNEPPKWMQVMGPYIAGLVKVLKFASPFAGPWVNLVDKQTYEKAFEDDIDFMIKVTQKLPDFGKQEKGRVIDEEGRIAEQETEVAEEAALRSLREFLDMRDHLHRWGNLRMVLTPEGHYLWLCEYHAKTYAQPTGCGEC